MWQLVRSSAPLVSEKHRCIKAILDDGFEHGPHARVIARFEAEKQAHAVESVLINFSYDLERQLPNAVRGHSAEFVRRFGDTSELPGIDVPQRVRVRDGTFANETVAGLRAAGAYEFKVLIAQTLHANAHVKWANSRHEGEPRYGDFWRTLADGKRARLKPVFEPDDLEGLYGTLEAFQHLLTASSEPRAA